MSKAVLLSIKGRHCYNIANYLKTVEVRKRKLLQEVPFKCYIYCTKGGKRLVLDYDDECLYYGSECSNMNDVTLNGTVIGEFICDKIDKVIPDYSRVYNRFFYDFKKMKHCLTTEELRNYGKGKALYAWHISNLKIYDKPKELSDFKKPCKYRESGECLSKQHNRGCVFAKPDLNPDGRVNIYECTKDERLTRPPQSCCYVEELE
jgi:predicted transcriptional regulator